MKIVEGLILGMLFGGALYYVGASNPKKLLSMLRLQDLSLMKIILFAIGFGSTLLSVAALIGIFDATHLSIKTLHLGVIIGGLIFGIGFGAVGTCPGTCVAATTTGGAGKAISAVLGGLTGAFIFSISYAKLAEMGLFNTFNLGALTWFNLSDTYTSVFNIGYLGLLIVGVIFMLVASLLPKKIMS